MPETFLRDAEVGDVLLVRQGGRYHGRVALVEAANSRSVTVRLFSAFDLDDLENGRPATRPADKGRFRRSDGFSQTLFYGEESVRHLLTPRAVPATDEIWTDVLERGFYGGVPASDEVMRMTRRVVEAVRRLGETMKPQPEGEDAAPAP